MYEFKVDGMTCGSCANTITRALKSSDPQNEVTVDLKGKTVRVESGQDQNELQSVIEDAGYTIVEGNKVS